MSLKNSEEMKKRLRRNARSRWLVLENAQSDEAGKSPTLCRKHSSWDPENSSGDVEEPVNSLDRKSRKKASSLSKNKNFNLAMVKKSSLSCTRS